MFFITSSLYFPHILVDFDLNKYNNYSIYTSLTKQQIRCDKPYIVIAYKKIIYPNGKMSIKIALEKSSLIRKDGFGLLEMPYPTLQNWDLEQRGASRWAEKLIIEKNRKYRHELY